MQNSIVRIQVEKESRLLWAEINKSSDDSRQIIGGQTYVFRFTCKGIEY